jgi:hypothetical protein
VAHPSSTSNKTTKYFGRVCSFFSPASQKVPATKQQFFPKVPLQWHAKGGTSNKTTKYFRRVCSFLRLTPKEVPATKQQFFLKVPMQWHISVVPATKQQNISEGYVCFLG